mmetsp:Transcript_23169/g.45596  ORF Transcript_23169/g.45596 Transcript_23169/m.45596 type:complete len:232 (-) Transcript_23169:480-1175(-)
MRRHRRGNLRSDMGPSHEPSARRQRDCGGAGGRDPVRDEGGGCGAHDQVFVGQGGDVRVSSTPFQDRDVSWDLGRCLRWKLGEGALRSGKWRTCHFICYYCRQSPFSSPLTASCELQLHGKALPSDKRSVHLGDGLLRIGCGVVADETEPLVPTRLALPGNDGGDDGPKRPEMPMQGLFPPISRNVEDKQVAVVLATKIQIRRPRVKHRGATFMESFSRRRRTRKGWCGDP